MFQDFEHAIARLPRWILALALTGAVAAGLLTGLSAAGGFLVGALAAYLNFRVIERAANRVSRLAGGDDGRPGRGAGVWIFIQFSGLVLGALVILNFSGFSRPAAFCGFLVCPAAAILEIIYELVTLKH
ncbi:MAG: ATP synthase subunit I [Acidobacteriota bacterium]